MKNNNVDITFTIRFFFLIERKRKFKRNRKLILFCPPPLTLLYFEVQNRVVWNEKRLVRCKYKDKKFWCIVIQDIFKEYVFREVVSIFFRWEKSITGVCLKSIDPAFVWQAAFGKVWLMKGRSDCHWRRCRRCLECQIRQPYKWSLQLRDRIGHET